MPLGLIEEVVAAAGAGEQRRRLLPAVSAVVFVLGLCLFSGEGYLEVARKLAGWLGPLAGPGGWHVPGTAALARARRRAGPAPLKLLFTRLAGPLASPATPGAAAFGRLLVALDGTLVDVPYTAANIAAFGPPPVRHGAGPYPQVRLVTVVACGTRGLMGAAFRGRAAARSSEQDLARKIARQPVLGPGMLVIADRNFCGYAAAAPLAATGADLLVRATSRQCLPTLAALPDGSARSVLATPASGRQHAAARRRGKTLPHPPAGLPVRVIDAEVTTTPAGGTPRTERYRLITTLTDHRQAPAAALAACYAQRWEAETSYREIKATTCGPAQVLRSRDPAGVTQEIWALLSATQLTHTHRAAAAHTAGHDPDRISYTITLRAIRRALTTTLPPQAIHTEALTHLLPPRRPRSYPRLMHTSTTSRRNARTPLTSTVTHTTTIIIMAPPTSPSQPGP